MGGLLPAGASSDRVCLAYKISQDRAPPWARQPKSTPEERQEAMLRALITHGYNPLWDDLSDLSLPLQSLALRMAQERGLRDPHGGSALEAALSEFPLEELIWAPLLESPPSPSVASAALFGLVQSPYLDSPLGVDAARKIIPVLLAAGANPDHVFKSQFKSARGYLEKSLSQEDPAAYTAITSCLEHWQLDQAVCPGALVPRGRI